MSSRTFGASRAIFSISGGHQQFDRQIRHHQTKLPLAADGVEIVRYKQPAHLVERLRQRPAQALRSRRQLHPRAGANQQGIAERLAQPRQRVAGGGLRQPDPHRGAADIGFREQRVQRHQ